MRIYLDNNATTTIHPDVLDRYVREMSEAMGNPSSVHQEGQRARRVLEEAREAVSTLIAAPPRQVIFTAGGTESNNLALFGAVAPGAKRCRIVTSAIEHPSVLEVMRKLEERGHEVVRIGCDRDGVIDVEAFVAAMNDDTRVVALMLANNETGVVQPVAAVAQAARQRGIHVHCDAVQAAGKIPVDVDALGVDTMALSGHKLHAPKGIGALFVRSGVVLEPLVVGGAQERRRRAGTENAPLAAAFGQAAQLAVRAGDPMQQRRDRLEAAMVAARPDTVVNGGRAPRLPNTSSLLMPGVDAEAMVIGFDLEGVALSTGSACSSGRVEPSHVLLAMGLSLEDARSSIRFSLSRFTTDEEVDSVVAIATRIAPRHQRLRT